MGRMSRRNATQRKHSPESAFWRPFRQAAIKPFNPSLLFARSEVNTGQARNPGAFPRRLNVGCQNDGKWVERWMGIPTLRVRAWSPG